MRHLAALGAWLLAASASAQPAADTNACRARHSTALGAVACELAVGLPRRATPTVVVPGPIRSALKTDRLDALSERLATLVAGELGPTARALGGGAWQELSTRAGSARVIVVGGELGRDRFSAVADELARVPKFWERLQKVAPGSSAHAFSSRLLDAELKTFLPSVPLVLSRVDKAAPLDEPSLAIACGDVDDDASSEIVSVGRQRIQIGRLEKGRFVPFQTLFWSRLADIAPTPLREPIASAVIASPGSLAVGSTDRGTALELDSSLRVVARYPGRLPWPGSACAATGAVGLQENVITCEPEKKRAAKGAISEAPRADVDALAGVHLVRSDGSTRTLLVRRRTSGLLELGAGESWITLPEPAGAQVALGDLDGDGLPELVSTSASRDPKEDFVLVRTVEEGGSLREVFRLPVPSGVQALGICPLESAALAPLVIATGDGLWVAR